MIQVDFELSTGNVREKQPACTFGGVQEYMRTQRKRGTKALVHRWYTPDSHNAWVDLSVAPEQVENDAEHLLSGPAKVYVRWVKVRPHLSLIHI